MAVDDDIVILHTQLIRRWGYIVKKCNLRDL
jgi:hypothetical protein